VGVDLLITDADGRALAEQRGEGHLCCGRVGHRATSVRSEGHGREWWFPPGISRESMPQAI
jgi:hypothetical protein